MAHLGGVVQVGECRQSSQPRRGHRAWRVPTAAVGLGGTLRPRGTRVGSDLSSALAGAANRGGFVRSRSNLLVLLGIAFFVVGGVIVFLLTDDDDDGGAGAAATVAGGRRHHRHRRR